MGTKLRGLVAVLARIAVMVTIAGLLILVLLPAALSAQATSGV